jgi:5-methylcytosine-specific restriction endonuclease McrA
MIELINVCGIIYSMGLHLNCSPLPVKEVKVEEIKTKKCSKCGQVKTTDQFYNNKNSKDLLDYWCVECKTNWRINNPEYGKIYYKKNVENVKKTVVKWREKNTLKFKGYIKKYRQTKKGLASIIKSNHKRRKQIKEVNYDLTSEQWEQIKKDQDFTCLHCGKKEPEIKLTRDHIIPLSKGGHFTKANIQGLCLSCNAKKRAKIDSRGFQLILKGDN